MRRLAVLGVCFLTSFVAKADLEVSAQAKCYQALDLYSYNVMGMLEQSCSFTDQNSVSVVASRNGKRGFYLFDQSLGEAVFYPMKEAPAVIVNSVQTGSYYTLATPKNKRGLRVVYIDQNVTPAMLQKKQSALNQKFTVTEKELQNFLKEKKISATISEDIKRRIRLYIINQKQVDAMNKASVRDPSVGKPKNMADTEAMVCDENSVMEKMLGVPPIALNGIDALDDQSKQVLRERCDAVLGNARIMYDSSNKDNVERKSIVEVLRHCDQVKDGILRARLAAFKEHVETSVVVGKPEKSSGATKTK